MPVTIQEYNALSKDNPSFVNYMMKFLNGIDIRAGKYDDITPYLEEYDKWCKENGFQRTLYKGESSFRNESKTYIKRKEASFVIRKMDDKNLKTFIKQLLRMKDPNRIRDIQAHGKVTSELIRLFNNGGSWSSKYEKFLNLLLHLEQKTKLLDTPDYIKALYNISEYYFKWIRDSKKWKPVSKNREKQFNSLVAHLFCKYEVPTFMFSAWSSTSSKQPTYFEWFFHFVSVFQL